MSARIAILCILLTVSLPVAALFGAEEADTSEFDELKRAVEALAGRVDGLEQKELVGLKSQVDNLAADLGNLKGSVTTLVEIATDQDAKLGAIAKKVSQGDGDTWVPDIRRAWENADFRQDMRLAVHDSMDRRGTVTIRNKTAVGQTLLVNNSQYVYVPAGENRTVGDIPVGTISTELVGYEGPRNWTLSAPVLFSPPPMVDPPVLVNPPLVVGPPVLVDAPVIYLW
jgi:hypothetical protein